MFWDFGGVILSSPFEAFARYERSGQPSGRHDPRDKRHQPRHQCLGANSSGPTSPSTSSACLFEAEATSIGHTINAREVMALLHGEVRPAMVEALRRCKEANLKVACLTNNVRASDSPGARKGKSGRR